jgi:hypothetical protein
MIGPHARPGVQVKAQLICEVFVQKPVEVSQHAPGHGLGLQLEPAPIHVPFAASHAACVMIAHVPITMLGSQQAPVGGGGHGLGLQIPPAVHEPLGGTGQFACVVCVQLPFASQQAP